MTGKTIIFESAEELTRGDLHFFVRNAPLGWTLEIRNIEVDNRQDDEPVKFVDLWSVPENNNRVRDD